MSRKIDDDDDVLYLFPSELSYLDDGEENVQLFVNDKKVGVIKVWLDDDEDDREYVCINHVIIYLDTLVQR